MKNMKFWRTALVATLVLTVMLSVTGGTIAWFTDSVTSSANVIQSGTLDLDVFYSNDNGSHWDELDENDPALFDYDKWEPGYVQTKAVQLKNNGTLALKYELKFQPTQDTSTDAFRLEDVIDVYVGNEAFTRDSLKNAQPKATLAQLMYSDDEDGAVHGELQAGAESGVIYIALKMQESAGNDYQGLSVGGGFGLKIVATQLAYEPDSFGNDYDKDAGENKYPEIPSDAVAVSNLEQLTSALANGGIYKIAAPFTVNGELIVSADTALYNNNPQNVMTFAENARIKTAENADLALYGIEIDGGGSYMLTDTAFNRDQSKTINNDAILMAFAGSKLTLGQGTTIQNVVSMYPAVAWAKGEVDNRATIILEGATIQNCVGGSGTIINVDRYGDVYIEDGTLIANNISSNGNHGIIRIYNDNRDAPNASTLNINGGEIRDNYFSGNGMIGLYYAKMNMNGGKISNNSWLDVTATGNGFYCLAYVHSNAQFIMNGGEISGNTITDGTINAINSEVVGAITLNGGTVTNNSNTRNENKDALAAVCYPGAVATADGTEKVLVISDNAHVTGTIYSHANLNTQVDKKYIELSEFLGE